MNNVLGYIAANPLVAIFLSIAIGYAIGKIRIGKFTLGGIAGSLIAAVIIGQLGFNIPGIVKTFFFGLFVFACGYNGGPTFFGHLNSKSLKFVISALVMTISGLFCVIIASKVFHFDAGLAAGLAAGGLTQSAIIGTAGDAIEKLGLGQALAKHMETEVAVGYSVTYIFGSLGPILMCGTIIPMLMKWDLKKEAATLQIERDKKHPAANNPEKKKEDMILNLITFSIGMIFGMLIGHIEIPLGSVPVSLGTGGGCLLSGLIFGWLRAKHPKIGGLDQGTANFLQSFGLVVFVVIVGLNAGRQAISTIQQEGMTLLWLGIFVTIVPQIITFIINYYLLNIRNPIEAVAIIAGGRSANPALSEILSKTENSTPVLPFTIGYAIANVMLTIWGPVIVQLMK